MDFKAEGTRTRWARCLEALGRSHEAGAGQQGSPEQELAAATLELAQKLASKSPLALQIGKEGLNQLQDLSYHQGLDAMDDLFATLASTEDAIEGVSAFRAKRKPVWKER